MARLEMSRSPPFIFGGSSLGGLYEQVDPSDAVSCLRQALSEGVVEVDTAPHYGCGSAESVLGSALAQLGTAAASVLISSKVGRVIVPVAESAEFSARIEHSNVPTSASCIFPGADRSVVPVLDFTESGFERSFQSSLKRLGVSRLHCLKIHDCDSEDRLKELASGGGIEYLRRLRESGLVKKIGIGCNDVRYSLAVLKLMPVADEVLIAGAFSLLDHPASVSELFAECDRRGVEVMIAGVFASGILATTEAGIAPMYRYSSASPEVLARKACWAALAAKFSLELSAVAVAFSLLPGRRIVVGLRSASEAEQAARWCRERDKVPAALWADALQQGLLEPHVQKFLPPFVL